MKAPKMMLLLIMCLSLLLVGCGQSFRNSDDVQLTFRRGHDVQGNKPTISTTFFNGYKYPIGVALMHQDYAMVAPGDSLIITCKTYERVYYDIVSEVDVGYNSLQKRSKVRRSGLFTYPDIITMDENFVLGFVLQYGSVTNRSSYIREAWDDQDNYYGILQTNETSLPVGVLPGPLEISWKIHKSDPEWARFNRGRHRYPESSVLMIDQERNQRRNGKLVDWYFDIKDKRR